MMALGTPTLLSSNVGAKQLFGEALDNHPFIFETGSVEDFAAKLSPLVRSRDARAAFFKNLPPLPTIEAHADRLLQCYSARTGDSMEMAERDAKASKSAPIIRPPGTHLTNGSTAAPPEVRLN